MSDLQEMVFDLEKNGLAPKFAIVAPAAPAAEEGQPKLIQIPYESFSFPQGSALHDAQIVADAKREAGLSRTRSHSLPPFVGMSNG